jgi:hypothetical protein
MTECPKHHKPIPCEECKSEEQKKAELYDPQQICHEDCDACVDKYNCPMSGYEEDDEDW